MGTGRPGWRIEGMAVTKSLASQPDVDLPFDVRPLRSQAPGTATTVDIPATTGTPATIQATPVDQFGRDGPTYVCDTSKPGGCPAA